MKIRTFLAAGTFVLSSCVNPYATRFQYAPGITPTAVAEHRAGPPSTSPELIQGSNPSSDVQAQEADGYMPIGYADFSAAPGFVPSDGAAKQGIAVGADRVLVYSNYEGTVTTAIPITTPTQSTTFYSGNATAYGSNGTSTTAYGTGSATTYGSQTQLMPLTIERDHYLAVYFIRAKVWLGAVYYAVDAAQAQMAGSVDAVRLNVVMHGTPAAAAGLVPGDIVTSVNGAPFGGVSGLMPTLMRDAGQKVLLGVTRNGQAITKEISLPALSSQ